MDIKSSQAAIHFRRYWQLRWLRITATAGITICLIVVLLPLVLQWGIGHGLKQQGATEVEITDVDFNPFAGTFELEQLRVRHLDQQPVVSIPRHVRSAVQGRPRLRRQRRHRGHRSDQQPDPPVPRRRAASGPRQVRLRPRSDRRRAGLHHKLLPDLSGSSERSPADLHYWGCDHAQRCDIQAQFLSL